jgi:hypothetical protein
MHSDPPLIQHGNVKQVADITGLTVSHLNYLRQCRPAESPPFFHIGRRVVYPLTGHGGVAGWMQRHRQRSEAR